MGTTCEVIGWLLVDTDRAQVMVREANGDISLQAPGPDDSFSQRAIQTGRFSRSDLDYTSGAAVEMQEAQARQDRAREDHVQKG